eukprot:9472700-Pyramimonas_sp.AAC.5
MKRSMSCCSVDIITQLAVWHAARNGSHLAIRARCAIFIRTLAAMGCSVPEGSGCRGVGSDECAGVSRAAMP